MMRYKIRPEPGLDFILPFIAVLTKEPEMLQTMRFASIQCSKMQLQSGLCSELRWSSGMYSASSDPLAGFKGVRGVEMRRQGERKERRRKGGEGC